MTVNRRSTPLAPVKKRSSLRGKKGARSWGTLGVEAIPEIWKIASVHMSRNRYNGRTKPNTR